MAKNNRERCKCCLEVDELENMWTEHYIEGEKEVYGKILTECFALTWQQPTEDINEHICKSCVNRLRRASNFKKEILCCQQLLLDEFKKRSNKEIDEVKEEENSDMEIESAYLVDDSDDNDKKDNIEINIETDNTIVEEQSTTNLKEGKYKKEDFDKRVEVVHNKTLTQQKASLLYKIPQQTIDSWVTRNSVKEPEKGIANRKGKKYTQDDLEKCLEAVRNKTMSQTRASMVYDVPRSTIAAALARRQNMFEEDKKPKHKGKTIERKLKTDLELVNTTPGSELQKHGDNIVTLLLNTNATPILSHQDYGYTCCFCSEAFTFPADLKEHTLTKHNIEEKKNFIKGKSMRSYLAKLDITGLKCKICSSNVDSLDDMMRHLKDHGEKMHLDINNHIIPFKFDEKVLRCIICKRMFNSFKMLLEHMSRHSKNYVCDVCGSGYVNSSTFAHHIKSHSKGVFPCDHCSKVFETKLKKKNHELVVHVHRQKTIKCGFCGEKFTSNCRKAKHISAVHGKATKVVECQMCLKIFNSIRTLREHTKRDHLQERRYSCDDCNMKFFCKQGLKNHMLKHTGIRAFQCDVCKKSYGKKWTLREHMRIHANDRRFKCEHCAMAFIQRCSLIGHIKSRHGEVLLNHRSKNKPVKNEKLKPKENFILPKLKINSVHTAPGDELQKHGDNIATLLVNTNATPIRNRHDYGYSCCFCPKAFTNPADLKEHTLTNHSTQEKKNFIKGKLIRSYVAKLDITGLKCKICNSDVDSLDEMMRHLKDHGEKMHFDINNQIVPLKFDGQILRCIICKRIFNTFKSLLEHMKNHSKNFVCDICGSGFINRITFVHHYKSHSKGAFPCQQCSQVFETKRRRRNHELVVHLHKQHTFKCGFCGEGFTSNYRKTKHVSVVHGVIMSTKGVECQVCHKMCTSVNVLKVHTKRVHLQERRYSCGECSMKFFTKGELKNHLLKHTGVREFQCEICKKSYGKKWTLREHMRIHENDRRFKCEHCEMAFVQRCSLIGHIKSRHSGIIKNV